MLNICSTLQVEQRRHSYDLSGKITKYERNLSSHVGFTTTCIQRGYSERFDRVEAVLGRHKNENVNQNGESNMDRKVLRDTMEAVLENLQDKFQKDSQIQGEAVLLMLQSIQAQLEITAPRSVTDN